jgi:hypothetical protein
MSRFLIAFSFVASLTSSAAAQHFAQPPGAVEAAAPIAEASLRIAPRPSRDVTRAQVRAKLVANRAANLARFRAYQRKGMFPSNTYTGEKLNVWRDEDGHFCAAATIIRMSGQTALVDRVAEQTNFIRLADVKQGPLMDWILTSGFTQAEIAAIQEPMMPVTRDPIYIPEPGEPVNVEPDLRSVENQRLMKVYKQVDRMLVKNQKASLELAVDRLMAHPELAAQLVYNG